ncbi:MAG TPA: hypothetical protein VJT73_04730 [Polyangiaceae bacterium]|nr:hypothetical protein [Polyangiaceae bacterium]
MTEKDDDLRTHDDEPLDTDQASVRSILQKAKLERSPEVDLLQGVQRRIRDRSRGRFYGDGWSRRSSATSTYVVTSLLMLFILVLVYFILVPEIHF